MATPMNLSISTTEQRAGDSSVLTRHLLHAVLFLCVLAAAAAPPTPAEAEVAQVPTLLEVPDTLLEPSKGELEKSLKMLKGRLSELKDQLKAFSARCTGVDKGSSDAAQCRGDLGLMKTRVKEYSARATAYNARVRETQQRQAKAIRRGQTRTAGIDVPPPSVKPKETLQEWVHRNWSKAPNHLKWKIQRTLHDPKALKELLMWNQIAIVMWYREATAESTWQKLVKGLPKALAWLGDPMHREWRNDAVTIGLLPLEALAVSKGALVGSRALLAAPKIARSSYLVKAQERALRARARAMARSSSPYYEFPRHYFGPDQPILPHGIFVGNPYRQVIRGVWYYEEAGSVRAPRVRRMPQWDKLMDKLMEELWTGSGGL